MNLFTSNSETLKLISKLGFLTLISFFITYVILAFFLENSVVDRFYPKLNSKQTNNLVLGTSRAFYGLNPDSIFKKIENHNKGINFAFSMSHSPWGAVYQKAISKKINLKDSTGIFILEVSPLSLSFKNKDIIDSKEYRENGKLLNRMFLFNGSPNFDYLLRMVEDPIYSIILKAKLSNEYGPKINGWNKVKRVDDSARLDEKIKKSSQTYSVIFEEFVFSNARLNYLKRIIEMLLPHGKVILIRNPVSAPMKEMEKKYKPDFDLIMNELSRKYTIPYLNFFNDSTSFRTIDVHHLDYISANLLSEKINLEIRKDSK